MELQLDCAIDLTDITFKRGDRVIFQNIDIKIPKGKITGIMGPSGSGKTTLLKMMTAEIRPYLGNVSLLGISINTLHREQLFDLRKQMGVLFQSGALFTDLNVFENVAFPLRVHTKLPEEMIRDIVLMKLQAVGLRGAVNLMPDELSGGMRRRISLASAIALDPQIILYDEPFAGQDPIAMGVLVRLIRKLNNSLGMTSVVVSHDIQETASIADYIYIVGNKKVLAHGPSKDILNSEDPDVKQFINGEPDGPVPFHRDAVPLMEDFLV